MKTHWRTTTLPAVLCQKGTMNICCTLNFEGFFDCGLNLRSAGEAGFHEPALHSSECSVWDFPVRNAGMQSSVKS